MPIAARNLVLRRMLVVVRSVVGVFWLLAIGTFQAADSARASSDRAADSPIFVEVEDSGLEFVHFNGALGDFLLPEITCAGAALFDYDRDGDLDLYLLQGSVLGAPGEAPESSRQTAGDRLFRNDLFEDASGRSRVRFVDVTEASGLARLAPGFHCAVAVGDFDNDGWPDLYVGGVGSNRLIRSRGDGTFEDVTVASGADDPSWSAAAAWFDYDRDGWLDLYVGNYLEFDLDEQKVCRSRTGVRDYCNPDAYVGVPDRLLRNRGDSTFEDVSQTVGLSAIASKSLGVAVEDFDGDGRDDLYVTNDGVANQLWLQTRDGGFSDQALLAGCAVNRQGKAEASMGVVAEDFDGDGDPDLFMTHLIGETNTLYINDGEAGFSDRTIASGIGPASWGFTSWGVAPVDFDRDGRLDLAVANGAVRVIEELAAQGDPFPFRQSNQLFRNIGEGRFTNVSASAGDAFAIAEVSRGLAMGDIDNDGAADLVVANNGGPARVLLHRSAASNSWLGARLLGPGGGERAGSRVEVETERGIISRRARTDGSFGAAHDPRVLLGLGEIESQSNNIRLSVTWPSGRTQTWWSPAGRYLSLPGPSTWHGVPARP